MMEVFTCEQGTDEWLRCRLGIPTASMFATVMAKGRGGKGESKTRRDYMLKLLGERLTGDLMESYSNAHMERGKEMEAEARAAYEFQQDVECVQVGFVRNGDKGASPDSLVGGAGTLEIKTKLPHLHLDALLRNEMPVEHRAQVQGQLWICEREFCDFVSYWPKLPIFITRVYRDDEYINETLAPAVAQFCDELDTLTDQLKAE